MEMNVHGSTMTVDSWGGNEGLPPLRFPSLELEDALGNSPQSGEERAPQAGEVKVTQAEDIEDDISDIDDQDDIAANANYVNIDKLLTPSSSEYYYSAANKNNRQLLEKVKKTKKKNDGTLEESGHSRVSILSTRSHTSAYRGAQPRKRDGSLVKSAMKRSTANKGVLSMSSGMSEDFDRSSLSVQTMKSAPIPHSEEERKTLKRCVFSSVDIREHERIAGDNPCVSSGVPLSIGWGYYQNPPVDINDYELNKGPSRDKIEMMVPATVRRQMLRDDFDVAVADLNAAMKIVNITKRQRRQTVAAEHMEGFQEVSQSVSRKFKRFLKGTSRKKEEKKMWEEAEHVAMKKYQKNQGPVNGSGAKVAPGNEAPPAQIRLTAGGN